MRKNEFTILVVDDEPGMREGLEKALSLEGFCVETARCGLEAVRRVKRGGVDLSFVDLKLPDIDGCEVARRIFGNKDCRDTAVVVMTAYATVETAVNAMKIGVADYIKKPFDNQDIISIALRFRKKKDFGKDPASGEPASEGELLFLNRKMKDLTHIVDKIKDCDIPVLILGESGTGKEVIARLVHSRSERRDKPFIGINCSAIPSQLMESELFGHEKGAFSDAVCAKPGKFEIVEDGTLFLDEIGDMEFKLQSKLLRVLEEKSFERIGGVSPVPFRARLIASTNRDLHNLVAEKNFRSDLYFRLKGIELVLPPLRERKDEIEYFIRHFMEIYCEAYGKQNIHLSSEALNYLREYDWPGNIRELKNVVESAVILAENNTVFLSKHFRLEMQGEEEKSGIVERERDFIIQALEKNRFNRTLAARELQVSRKTLYNKMKKYSIN